MTEERRIDRDLETLRAGVLAAAERYRDAMRRYMAEQAAAMERGVPLDELVQGNWPSFQNAAQAEEDLFALLDELDAMRVRGE